MKFRSSLRESPERDNVWDEIGTRYAQGAPPSVADAINRDKIRFGDSKSMQVYVGNGSLGDAFALDRPAFFSKEETILQIPPSPAREWKVVLGHEWLDPLQGVVLVEEVGYRALMVQTIFRVRYGIGSANAEVLLSPQGLSVLGGPPTGGDATVFPDASALFNVQYAPYEGSQGAIQLTNDPSVTRVAGPVIPPSRASCMVYLPSEAFTISAYIMVIPFTQEGGIIALPDDRTFYTQAYAMISPIMRGGKT